MTHLCYSSPPPGREIFAQSSMLEVFKAPALLQLYFYSQ